MEAAIRRHPSQGESINQMFDERRSGFSLPQGFYKDPAIFDLDIEKIWMRKWLYAGHISQLAEADSYFLFQLGDESVIILKDEDGDVRAHANVCTHRGSCILTEHSGRAKNLVCPYHQWVFGRNGSLRLAKLAEGCENLPIFSEDIERPEPFDPSLYSLKSVHCKVLEGFIFVCFAADPPSFEKLEEVYRPHLQMYSIAKTKIAYSKTYQVEANWKLIGENARECYHCGVGHPEYCKVIPGSNLLRLMQPFEELRARKLSEWQAKGIPTYAVDFTDAQASMYCLRYPYTDGFVTQSLNGKQVAPLLGNLDDIDVGVFSIVQYPDFWLDVNPDHFMQFALRPISATRTDVVMTWFVRENAIAGKDYEVESVIGVWKATGEQDWRLCSDNQRGVNSRFYRPGPHTSVEAGPEQFDSWYMHELQRD